jgi:DNA-binding NarL/FixJ family response regulator
MAFRRPGMMQRDGAGVPAERNAGGRLIRVLVWAKAAIMRAGLEALVCADARFEVVASDRRSASLQTIVRELAPDVVLLYGGDEPIPPVLTEVLCNDDAPSAVVLVDQVRRVDVLRVLQAGARGVLLQEARAEEIVEAIAAVHGGLAVFSTEILDVLAPALTELAGDDELPPGEPLTQREVEVLALLADGAGNKEIARRMQISEHTVKFHVSSILNKLGAATRTEAVTRGYREGLILI